MILKEKDNYEKMKNNMRNVNEKFDEQDVISALQAAFEGEIMHTQYGVQNKRLDLYFSKGKLGIEIDEHVHVDKNKVGN